MIEKRFPHTCPSCESLLNVQRLHCEHCSTDVEGSFKLPLLARLSNEEQEFILNFIKMSGSLKEMAGIMNRSYPSVRNYLDELIGKVKMIEQQNQK